MTGLIDGTLDASALLSLGEAEALNVLTDSVRHRWHITPTVRGEILSKPTKDELDRAILDGKIVPIDLDVDSPAEKAAFAEWSRRVDAGEAEAISVAVARGWAVAIEDLFAQRALSAAGHTNWLNCAALLIEAVREGRLDMAEADAIFAKLNCYKGYCLRGVRSLRHLLRE